MAQDTANPLHTMDSSTRALVSRLVRAYVRPYVRFLGWAVLFMIVSAAMTAVFAKLIEPVIDTIMTEKNADMIAPLGFAVFFVFLISGLATYFHTLLINKIGQSIVADIQRELFSRLMNLDLAFFHANPSGHIISRIVNDTHVMRAAVADGLTGIGKSLLTLLLLVIVMFIQNWQLAAAIFIIFPIAAFFVSKIGKRLRKISKNLQAEIATLTYTLSQIFQGIRQVKAYGMESAEGIRAGKVIDRARDLSIKGTRVGTLTTPINEALVGLAIMGVIIVGGYQVVVGQSLTTGQLLSFITAFSLAYEPMKRLAKLNNTIQTGLGAAERVFAMMDCRPEIVDKTHARTLHTKAPQISFENVSFSYAGAEGHALQRISLVIPSGKVTALVGPSGSGKTTIMNLIPRFYDVTEGRILIDDHEIKDVSLKSLRENIALVSQDITIFDDTARANIAYGKANATEEEIVRAAKLAAAHDFIMALPEGYDTVLGENGVTLSGGQRQRLAIARAILRDAPILLLDEATSALDNESERLIQESLRELQKGRTTLVIAHRLSTIQHADQIIVLDRGEVKETGRHEELVNKRDSLFARMHAVGLSG